MESKMLRHTEKLVLSTELKQKTREGETAQLSLAGKM